MRIFHTLYCRIVFYEKSSSNKPKIKINSKTITEKTNFKNPDEYGNTKIKMEKILKKFCNDKNKKGLILRLPGIIGPKSKNNFLSIAN